MTESYSVVFGGLERFRSDIIYSGVTVTDRRDAAPARIDDGLQCCGEPAAFENDENCVGRGAPSFGVRSRGADRRSGRSVRHVEQDDCRHGRARRTAQRKLPFHATMQLQLRILLSHGEDVVRAATGRGEARADHAGGSRHEKT